MHGTTHYVRMNVLGSFDLLVDDKSVSALNSHASKLRNILCYLVLHRDRAVSHTELIETFYEDESQSNPAGALKMQVMRIRNAVKPLLGGDISPIISRRGAYQWNPDLICQVDAEEFEQFCLAAEQPKISDDEKLLLYQQAIDLYKGDPDLEADSLLWSRTISSRYSRRYIAAVEKYAALLETVGDYSEMEDICLKAIEKNPTDETLYILAIQAMLKQKKYPEARKLYNTIVDLLYHDLGVRPSPELQQLYAQCEEEENPWEQDLSSVMVSMRNPEEARTAFLCGFEQFKSIYQLEVRRALRSGGCLHVAMLTVFGSDGKVLPTKVNNVLMEQVQQTVVRNLRQSDVVAQYSNCQFVIMLPYANLEDSCMVMDRIVNAYHASNPRNVVRLSYQIRELELL